MSKTISNISRSLSDNIIDDTIDLSTQSKTIKGAINELNFSTVRVGDSLEGTDFDIDNALISKVSELETDMQTYKTTIANALETNKEYLENAYKNYIDEELKNFDGLEDAQMKHDESLLTESKEIVGAINELAEKINGSLAEGIDLINELIEKL